MICKDSEEFNFFWEGFASSDKLVNLKKLSIKSFANEKVKQLWLSIDQLLINSFSNKTESSHNDKLEV